MGPIRAAIRIAFRGYLEAISELIWMAIRIAFRGYLGPFKVIYVPINGEQYP